MLRINVYICFLENLGQLILIEDGIYIGVILF